MSAERQPDHKSTPYNIQSNEDGDVIAPDLYDQYGEIENFLYPDEEDALKSEEQAAQEAMEVSGFQEMMDNIPLEKQHAAQVEISAQLAEIAVKKLVALQDAVLEAAQTGDKVDYLRTLKELEKHIDDNPGINGPSAEHE